MSSQYGIWFPSVKVSEENTVRIVCFPFAGAGATTYLDWFRQLPDNVDCFPVAYPLREKRRKEEMPVSLKELAFQIAKDNFDAFIEKPVVFYGHCEGGIIAYETAVALKKLYGISPKLFVASGVNPPCVPISTRIDENMTLEDASRKFVELGFIPQQFAKVETYLKCFVPVLLKDYILFQNYLDTDYQKIDCNILEVHGSEDPMINSEHTREWQKYTSKDVIYKEFPGEHFFITKETLPQLFNLMLEL